MIPEPARIRAAAGRAVPVPVQDDWVVDPRTLNDDFRLTALHRRPKPTKGIDAWLERQWGRRKGGRRAVAAILAQAEGIERESRVRSSLSDGQLRRELSTIRDVFRRGGRGVDDRRPEALALVCEAVHRTLGFRPYAVQIAGALALEKGFIAEMGTGEGKTVTIAIAATLRGWSGLPCHVLTANDYLAGRDARIMEPLFSFCGTTVGSVVSGMEPRERQEAYSRDVTYATANEVLADFLRDRIALGRLQQWRRRTLQSLSQGPQQKVRGVVMRGLHTAIVDEADNVLIDEAVTPLIISRQEPNPPFEAACRQTAAVADTLVAGRHYVRDEEFRTVTFLVDPTPLLAGRPDAEDRIFAGSFFRKDLLRQALVAREFFHRDRQYVVEDGKVVIVDESTGRKMPMRSWSAGLHQMVEHKEGLPMSPVTETQARMSFQRFFRFYRVFSGMTGTGREAAGEFWQVYGTPVLPIPPNRPSRREQHPLRSFRRESEKWDAIVEEVARVHASGRPILVGTRDVRQSERIARRLVSRGLTCCVVNAVRQDEEADVIAVAGKPGAITVATNMAGRGTDIKIPPEVEELGGLHVIACEFHRSARIDRQLWGRSARQGDRGSAAAFVSLEDELLVDNLPPTARKSLDVLRRTFPRAADRLAAQAVRLAQAVAQRKDMRSRLSIQETDTWLDDSLSFSQDDIR
jgi:preprotein translocase subunit SecA